MDLSVIVPAYNEKEFIEKCCYSLQVGLKNSGLTYEVIVIDNGSTDGTCQVLESMVGIKLFSIDRGSISRARNYGVGKSSGQILAFVDADVVICRKWVDSIEKITRESLKPLLTGFQYLVRPGGTWIERHWFSSIRSSHINGGNLIISRPAFDQLKGFNEDLKTGEDVDLCERARRSGEIVYLPDEGFEAIHLGYPRTIKHFMKRELWHGEGDFLNLRFFLRSKIALIATFYAVSQILTLALFLFGFFSEAVISIIVLLTINFLITGFRFSEVSLKSYISNSILNYFYFMARFGSLFKALSNRSKTY